MGFTSELLKERATILARLDEINAALKQLQNPASAVRIRTSRNLRNTSPFTTRTSQTGIMVYADEEMTVAADESDHCGYVSGEDAAVLRTQHGGIGL
jgi:hypothetical protein